MRWLVVIALVACGSRDADNAEQYTRFEDALEQQIETDARAGVTRTFASRADAEQFLRTLTSAGFKPRPELFANIDVGRAADYAKSHPEEAARRTSAFMARIQPLLGEVGRNIQRQFPKR